MNRLETPHVAIGEARGLVETARVLRAGELGPVDVLEDMHGAD